MSKNITNVFISHHGEDDDYVAKFKDHLKSKGLELKNSSIDSTKPNDANNEDYIKQILRPRIEWASTTVVLIGQGTHESDWVNWEIEYANRLGKRIVGVFLPGATESEIPEKLEDYQHSILSWGNQNVVDVIRGECDDQFEKPDGTPRSTNEKARDNC